MRARLILPAVLAGLAIASAVVPGAALGATAPRRHWTVAMSPHADDLAVAAISFPHAGHRVLSAQALAIGPLVAGDDFFGLAMSRRAPRRALLLVVNRPSPLEDPVTVRVRFSALARLGRPVVRIAANPIDDPPSMRPNWCTLPRNDAALKGVELRILATRGEALKGFAAGEGVAQAYDAVCGLPFAASFKEALTGPETSSPEPEPEPEPVPAPPGCQPCPPRPGFACPLSARAAVCVAPVRSGAAGFRERLGDAP
ncbi:MAG TPA: hypothetical protein VH061_06355 [Solirubrobacteraceae bacterium]|nr:hypothetical protein [Solirubrobacteraceae bacterium]